MTVHRLLARLEDIKACISFSIRSILTATRLHSDLMQLCKEHNSLTLLRGQKQCLIRRSRGRGKDERQQKQSWWLPRWQ